jgi:hypothetical protein
MTANLEKSKAVFNSLKNFQLPVKSAYEAEDKD